MPMTLYEIILRRPERDDEVRFTDHKPEPGALLTIDCRGWRVGPSEPSSHHIAQNRFVCVIDNEGRKDPPRLQRT
jgi:hypothetical protein